MMGYFVFTAVHFSGFCFKYNKFETIEEAEKFIEDEMKESNTFNINNFVIIKGIKLEANAKEVITKVKIEEKLI